MGRYREKLARITDVIRYYKVNETLAQRVRDYVDYSRSIVGGGDMTDTLLSLPIQLRGEVAMSLYEDIISKAPILGHSNRNFLRDIAIKLRVYNTHVSFIFNEIVLFQRFSCFFLCSRRRVCPGSLCSRLGMLARKCISLAPVSFPLSTITLVHTL